MPVWCIIVDDGVILLIGPCLPARHICTVALDMRSNASRQASAGGHLSTRSPRTDVAARIVKSTSSIESRDLTSGECQMVYRNEIPNAIVSTN